MSFTSTGGNTNPATQANVGIKESIYDRILLIGPDETPFLNKVGTSPVTNIKDSWLIDKLANPTRKPQLEISDFAGGGTSTKQKKENAVEIFTDDILISKSMQKMAMHGGKELPYQTAKKIKEHKLKLEMAMIGLGRDDNAKVSVFKSPIVRAETVPGEMAGMFHFLAKSDSAFSNGKRGNVLAYDSTSNWGGVSSVMTWDIFNTILQNIYDAGETPKDVYLGADLKKAVNNFVTRQLGNENKYNGRVTSLETDFGTVNINLHRMLSAKFGLGDAMIAGNFEYMKNGLLYSTEIEDVTTSKTATAKRIYTECTLQVRNADAFVAAVGLKA